MLNKSFMVNRNVVFSFIFLIILNIFMYFTNPRTTSGMFVAYLIYAIIGYTWIIISSKNISGKIVSYYSLFIIATVPFYFGEQILILLGMEEGMQNYTVFSILSGIIDDNTHIIAMRFIINSLQLINVGYLMKNTKKQNRDKRINVINVNSQDKAITIVTELILIVVTIPTFAYLIYNGMIASALGHNELRNQETSLTGIFLLFSYISKAFLPACYMNLVTCKRKNRKYGFLLILLYSIFYLLSGSRKDIVQIVVMLTIILLFVYKIKVEKKLIIRVCIIGYILIVILRAASYSRDLVGGGITLESVQTVLGSNILVEFFMELGMTYNSIANMFKCCPSKISFNNGMSYVCSLFLILPPFFRPAFYYNTILHISGEFSPFYFGFSGVGYGSSFLTEAYFNLNYFAYIFCFAFGMLLNKITMVLSNFSDRCNRYKFLFFLCLADELVWGIRSDLYEIPKYMLYYVVLPLLCAKAIEYKQRIK